MKNLIGTCLFIIVILMFLFKNCSGDSESSFIEVEDWTSEVSVRKAMQGKWYTSQDQLASSQYYVSGGSGFCRIKSYYFKYT